MLGPARRLWSARPCLSSPCRRPGRQCDVSWWPLFGHRGRADHLCTVAEAQAETGATRLRRSLCRRFHSTRLRIHRPSQPAGFSGNRFSNAAKTPDRCGPSVRVLRHEIATGFGHDCRRRTTIPAVRDRGVPSMCDYSLQYVACRPAKVGDKLVSTKFSNSITGGFAAVGEPNVAVCLLPGTAGAFEKEVECEHPLGFFTNWMPGKKFGEEVARLRPVKKGEPPGDHDGAEVPQ